MKRWYSLWLTIGLMGLFAVNNFVTAAEYSPTLEEELSKAGGKDFISAIVILESPLPINTNLAPPTT